jgi:hypothetical protein
MLDKNLISYEDIKNMPGVKNAFSEFNANPLRDENITIFFNNGYRLISAKSPLGQSIELEPFDKKLSKTTSSYKAMFYQNRSKTETTQNATFTENDISINANDFSIKLNEIVGAQIFSFLSERHQTVEFFSATNLGKRRRRF